MAAALDRVEARYFTGNDMAAALDRVEARYRAKASPAQLHTFDLTQPSGLPALLAVRGYHAGETTLTMLSTAATATEPPGDVAVTADPTPEWLAVYLEAITDSRRAVNQQILR